VIPVRNIQDAHKWYSKRTTSPVSLSVYRAIINGFIKFMMKKVFDGHFVQLSGGNSLGVIGVVGTPIDPKLVDGKIQGVPVSWGKTYQLWKKDPEAKKRGDKIYCFNEHSDGIRYNLRWITKDMKLPNKIFYSLTFCRENRRTFSSLVTIGEVEYYVKPKLIKNV